MKKLSFDKFNTSKIDSSMLSKISGGDYSTAAGSVTMSNVLADGGVYASCTVSWSSDTGRDGVGVISYNNETRACAGFTNMQ